MDKRTMLWIRACKSQYPYDRTKSLYRRLYGKHDDAIATAVIARELGYIVDKHCPMKLSQIMHATMPSIYVETDDRSHVERFKDALIGRIRYTHQEKFVGLTKPLIWRRVNG